MKKIFIIFILTTGLCTFLFSSDYKDFINEGVILLRQGKTEEAIQVFEKAKNLQPSSPYPYYYIGEAYYFAGKGREALDYYNKAIEIDDKNPDFYYSLAYLHLSEGNTEEAIKSLDRVIEIAPSSLTGKMAKKLKETIQTEIQNKELVRKWTETEIEERKKKEEAQKPQQEQPEGEPVPGQEEMLPPEIAGTEMQPGLPQPGEEKKEEKVPVELLIKRIKFGTETVRYQSSVLLLSYDQSELINVIPDMVEIVKESREIPVRKNVILALGKTESSEGINTILAIIQDKNELYDIKITAVDAIAKVKRDDIAPVLRNTLKAMLDKRENEIVEAQKNIKDIIAKIESLEAQKIALNMQIQQEEQKKAELQQKIEISGAPPEFGLPPGIPQTPQAPGQKILTPQEIQKIRSEIRKIEESIAKKREDISKIDNQLTELQQQKGKYEALLLHRAQKRTDIAISAASLPGQYGLPPGLEGGLPPGIMPSFEGVRYEETSEDKNEVIFALKLIRALGNLRDKQAISTIKRAWNEYGVDNEKIYYLLTLARLGDYSGISELVVRIGQDYPQTNLPDEIELRKGIIEVIGEYLVQNPDPKLQGMIEFLSEEGTYPEIKETALNVLASLKNANR